MQSFVFITFGVTFWTIILNFCFHNSTYCNDITTYTGVNKIVFYFTFNSFWHFSRIYIIDIVFNLLNFKSLIKRCSCSMFLRIKKSTLAININASIGCLPFSFNKTNNNFRFTFMASELN